MLGRAALSLAALALPAQEKAAVCPYCRSDPALLRAAGLVSHGPFPFAKDDTAKLRAVIAPASPIFLESKHFRIASSLGPDAVPESQSRKIREELEALRASLPAVPKKTRTVDPWLRLHLYAMRAERFYERFERILQVTDADFPDAPTREAKYMGEGRYLGEKEKYEILLHEDSASHSAFLLHYAGVKFADTVRWHFNERHAIAVSVPCVNPRRGDQAVVPHLAHGLSHLLLAGYKHYSYDPPLWIDEGLAHWCEREVDPGSNTFDSDEKVSGPRFSEEDWASLALRVLSRGKAGSLAELAREGAVGDLDRDDHVLAWSKVDFFLRTRPKEFALLLDRVKGRLDAKGYPNGKDLVSVQRDALRDLLGWSFADFDREWEAWARKAYPPK